MDAPVSSSVEGVARTRGPADDRRRHRFGKPYTSATAPPVDIVGWRPLSAFAVVAIAVAVGLALDVALLALDDGRAVTAASGLLVDLVLLAVVVVAASRGARRLGGATLGLRRTALAPAIGWGATLLLATWLGEGLLHAIIGGGSADEGGRHATGAFDPGVAVLLVAAVAVSAPIVEEIVFRGYLFPALAGWRGPWTGALLTAVVFAAAHVLALPPQFLPGIAVFGFGACLLRWFTGSLLPGIAMHAFNNAVVLTALSDGQLWWALPAAPLAALLLVAPFSRARAEDIEDAVAA